MLENEDLRKEEQEEVEADEVKKSKIKSGLSVEVKQLIEKYEREAKALNKSFINFASENKILYVLRWILKENRKITETEIRNNNNRYITADVVRMQQIMTRSNEIMEERAREKGEE